MDKTQKQLDMENLKTIADLHKKYRDYKLAADDIQNKIYSNHEPNIPKRPAKHSIISSEQLTKTKLIKSVRKDKSYLVGCSCARYRTFINFFEEKRGILVSILLGPLMAIILLLQAMDIFAYKYSVGYDVLASCISVFDSLLMLVIGLFGLASPVLVYYIIFFYFRKDYYNRAYADYLWFIKDKTEIYENETKMYEYEMNAYKTKYYPEWKQRNNALEQEKSFIEKDMQRIVAECKAKSNLAEPYCVPKGRYSSSAPIEIYEYFRTGRVDTLKEGLNLFIQEVRIKNEMASNSLHRMEMEKMQNEANRAQERAIADSRRREENARRQREQQAKELIDKENEILKVEKAKLEELKEMRRNSNN